MNIQDAYDEWSQSYDGDENLTRDLDRHVIVKTLADRRFDSILEIGCGTGKNTVFLAQIGARVHALDFSQGMLEKARQKVRAQHVTFSLADLTRRWPCEDHGYDLVVCSLVLEHIEHLSFVFSEASRVLRAGGMFLVNELHPFRQYEGKKARFEQEGSAIEVDAFVHHISDFVHAASNNGFILSDLNEWWHEQDAQARPPRLVSFIFQT